MTRCSKCSALKKVEKLIERNVIEVAPLAYMRGRTLKRRLYHSG
ncbi:phosphate starvation-inducible protein, ATP-binding [Salmonella enterica subsp. enterica]|uniref:Phosphate starvation-inducible protein, ATP-binding n=1 Tax=Salmonella enterica I TaxID=59201 RepID=A0A3S4IN13_SALET|nr:phosphate starvation-inducible protein, ATP-binding [Salmonella enterica subsp. enterica]